MSTDVPDTPHISRHQVCQHYYCSYINKIGVKYQHDTEINGFCGASRIPEAQRVDWTILLWHNVPSKHAPALFKILSQNSPSE
jgi:hypothetical protein